jgi:hypothetical protein
MFLILRFIFIDKRQNTSHIALGLQCWSDFMVELALHNPVFMYWEMN